MPSLASLLRRSAVFVLLALASFAQAAGLRLELQTPALYTGTQFNSGATVTKNTIGDGIIYSGPFVFHASLPAGTRFLSGSGGGWTCSIAPPDAREIVCTSNATLSDPTWTLNFLSLTGYTDPSTPLGPTTITATISSPDVPLPPQPECVPSPSATGCATVAPAVAESSLEISGWGNSGNPVSTWPIAIEAGTQQNILVADIRNIGFGASNTPVTLNIKFPMGVTYSGSASGIPTWTCAAQEQPDGQLLSCTTPAMFPNQTGFVSFRSDFAHDVTVPGPHYFHAAIGNNVVPPPTDCIANPQQRGCGRLAVNTRPPSIAVLAFADPEVQHSQAYFTLGEDNGPIVVNFRNLGDSLAARTTLQIKLPPGFTYTQTFSALPALSCVASGASIDGQLLTCQGAGLPASSNGFVSFGVHLDAGTEVPGPVPLVGAIDMSDPPSAAQLSACVADPGASNCFWHEVPTYARCGYALGAENIFCDAFEELGLPGSASSD